MHIRSILSWLSAAAQLTCTLLLLQEETNCTVVRVHVRTLNWWRGGNNRCFRIVKWSSYRLIRTMILWWCSQVHTRSITDPCWNVWCAYNQCELKWSQLHIREDQHEKDAILWFSPRHQMDVLSMARFIYLVSKMDFCSRTGLKRDATCVPTGERFFVNVYQRYVISVCNRIYK